jgi:hypothetical protein
MKIRGEMTMKEKWQVKAIAAISQ